MNFLLGSESTDKKEVESKSEEKEVANEFIIDIEKQYKDMPDCFKNIFSLDENGNLYDIRDSKEVKNSWIDFWNRTKLDKKSFFNNFNYFLIILYSYCILIRLR